MRPHGTWTPMSWTPILLLAALLGAVPAAAQTFNYFPGDADTDDGRTVALAGERIHTLAQDHLNFLIAVPPGETSFELGIFDGDTGGRDAAGVPHWDHAATQLQYALFYDPHQQATTDPAHLVGVWRGNESNPTLAADGSWVASAATFPDDGWWTLTVFLPQPPEPQPGMAPSGASFYHLCISYGAQVDDLPQDPCTGQPRPADAWPQTISSFRLRAASNITVQAFAFAFEAALRLGANGDVRRIYPDWDQFVPVPGSPWLLDAATTYDGSWSFFLDVPVGARDLELFDGDFDFGTGSTHAVPCLLTIPACTDGDDPDTPNAADYPPWVMRDGRRVDGSMPESAVAAGGAPADDNRYDVYRRSPCVHYTLTSPGADGDLATAGDNHVYRNDDPSSDCEWERFRVSALPGCDASPSCNPDLGVCADHCADGPLPAGTWRVDAFGVDLSNLNAWRSNFPLCVGDCGGVRPYLVGDTVFWDVDGDGVQEPGEPGISGVLLELVDPLGLVLATVRSGDPSSYTPGDWEACRQRNTGGATADGAAVDEAGLYCFEVTVPNLDLAAVDSIDYTVRVAAGEFDPGGTLFEYFATVPRPTRPSPQQTATLVEGGGNVMTYDFGYHVEPPGTGTIGYWKTHPEAWPLDRLTMGGVLYTREEALARLAAPPRGDMSTLLAQQWIAGVLNVAAGNPAGCILDTLEAADAFLAAWPPGSRPRGGDKTDAEELKDVLDVYNNGRLCAPHRG